MSLGQICIPPSAVVRFQFAFRPNTHSPLLVFSNHSIGSALGLRIASRLFQRHQRVGLFLPGLCSEYVPKAIEAFNASDFEGYLALVDFLAFSLTNLFRR